VQCILATQKRKIRKQRGSRYHGWGQVGQHRKSGMQGGKGLAGLHKHKFSWMVKYDPDHFGHPQLNPPNRTIVKKWINVGALESLYLKIVGIAPKEQTSKKQEKVEIDLLARGYDKLLGGGKISFPFSLRVKSFTASAKAKVEKAGGVIIT